MRPRSLTATCGVCETDADALDPRGGDYADALALGVERRAVATGDELAMRYSANLGPFHPSARRTNGLGRSVRTTSTTACTQSLSAGAPPLRGRCRHQRPFDVDRRPVESGRVGARSREGRFGEHVLPALPRLVVGTAFETAVAVAWRCVSRSAVDSAAASPLSMVERSFSSGEVLALGRRRSVAVRLVAMQWLPPALVEDMVVSFVRLCSVVVRSHVPV